MTLINRHFIMVNVDECKMRIQERDDMSAEIHIRDVDDSKIANAIRLLGKEVVNEDSCSRSSSPTRKHDTGSGSPSQEPADQVPQRVAEAGDEFWQSVSWSQAGDQTRLR
jgi:hypothetical protein